MNVKNERYYGGGKERYCELRLMWLSVSGFLERSVCNIR
jgi:hypothetical protein